MRIRIVSAISLAIAMPAAAGRPVAPELKRVDDYTMSAPVDLRRGLPAIVADGDVTAVIEIPAGTNEKWEVKEDGKLHWDFKDGKPRVVKYLGYPVNYGMVPSTVLAKDSGGDGDPLDVLVLGPAIPAGTVLPVRVIGLMHMTDGGEKDDKLVAVVPDTPFAKLQDIAELDAQFPGVTRIIATWFDNYKGPGKVVTDGFGDAAAAQKLVAESVKSFADATAKAASAK